MLSTSAAVSIFKSNVLLSWDKMRRLLQWIVNRCPSLSPWQLIQIVILVSYLSAQFVLHVQLSRRLTDALARLDKLEDYINGRESGRAQMKSYDTRPRHVHSREKRHTDHEGNLNDLRKRIETLQNHFTASRNFSMPPDQRSLCVQGPQGRNGMPGKNGIPGRDGKDGIPGRDGRDGTDGRDGIPGINGIPGRQGLPGRDGSTGPRGHHGQKGHKGKQGPKGPPGDPIMCHKETITKSPKQEKSGGTVFIRWGRSVCPDRGAVLVYEGQVAGWRSTPQGGGTNYLCMPSEPLYSKPPTPGYHSKASLFGVEYGHVEDLFARFPGRGPEISYLGVPCAVCRVEHRGSVVMIPARNVCPSRLWTREYHGYLMTDTSNSTRPEYICVDADATGVNVIQSKRHAGKALLASVQGQCGVLPCSKYRQDWELTCAVCTM